MNNQSSHFYEFEEFRLDPDRRILMRGNDVVPLTPKQFSLLFVLVLQKGRLVSSEELKKAVWPESRVVENKTLTQTIYSVRAQLGDSANQQRFIENVPRKGYRFACGVQEWHNGQLVTDNSYQSPAKAKRRLLLGLVGFRHWIPFTLLGLVMIVGILLWLRPAHKPTGEIEMYWPKQGAEVSEVEPFKAAVKGLRLDEYRMFWHLGDNRMNLMVDSNEGYPHKMFLVTFTNWTWRGRGPYKVNLVALGKNDEVIAQKSLEFFVKQ